MKKFIFSLGVLFLGASLASASFPDVSSSHPNYDAITKLAELEVIGGYPDGTFQPDKAVNRVEALKIILLSQEYSIPSTVSSLPFPDTSSGAWYAGYVSVAVDNAVVNGYPDGKFYPENTLNLVESLKMVTLAGNIDPNTIYGNLATPPYNDVPVDEWYSKYMQYAKDYNLLDPDAAGNVYPGKQMTRGSLVEIMYRLYFKDDMSSEDMTETTTDTSSDDDWFGDSLDELEMELDTLDGFYDSGTDELDTGGVF